MKTEFQGMTFLKKWRKPQIIAQKAEAKVKWCKDICDGA